MDETFLIVWPISSHLRQWLKQHETFNQWYQISKEQYIILPLTVTLCSPVPGCVKRSIWTDTSPTAPSSWLPVSKVDSKLFKEERTK